MDMTLITVRRFHPEVGLTGSQWELPVQARAVVAGLLETPKLFRDQRFQRCAAGC